MADVPDVKSWPKANISGADRGNHSLFRRALSYGFSVAFPIADQQPLINKYIDLLIMRTHEGVEKPIGVVELFNWPTFDITGDLPMGESFGCLENNRAHF
ncbi:hypothetical protein LTR93_010852 [Exophiala xenobiotica]|nr:hypothetical protein LTR93_010852 [Exophiala xenobiotica]